MIFDCQGGLAEGDSWQAPWIPDTLQNKCSSGWVAMRQSLTHEPTKTVFEQGITWFSG